MFCFLLVFTATSDASPCFFSHLLRFSRSHHIHRHLLCFLSSCLFQRLFECHSPPHCINITPSPVATPWNQEDRRFSVEAQKDRLCFPCSAFINITPYLPISPSARRQGKATSHAVPMDGFKGAKGEGLKKRTCRDTRFEIDEAIRRHNCLTA
jgi:hypothetical protein